MARARRYHLGARTGLISLARVSTRKPTGSTPLSMALMHRPAAPAITDATERERYEAHLGDELAGILEYAVKRGRLALIHTEVSPAHEGRGVGSSLVRFALGDARRRGLRIIAICPYVKDYLRRHPEDDDIVVGRGAAASPGRDA